MPGVSGLPARGERLPPAVRIGKNLPGASFLGQGVGSTNTARTREGEQGIGKAEAFGKKYNIPPQLLESPLGFTYCMKGKTDPKEILAVFIGLGTNLFSDAKLGESKDISEALIGVDQTCAALRKQLGDKLGSKSGGFAIENLIMQLTAELHGLLKPGQKVSAEGIVRCLKNAERLNIRDTEAHIDFEVESRGAERCDANMAEFKKISPKDLHGQMEFLKKLDACDGARLLTAAARSGAIGLEMIYSRENRKSGLGPRDFLQSAILSKMKDLPKEKWSEAFSLMDSSCIALAGGGSWMRRERKGIERAYAAAKTQEEKAAVSGREEKLVRDFASRVCSLSLGTADVLKTKSPELSDKYFKENRLSHSASGFPSGASKLEPGQGLSMEKLCAHFNFGALWEKRLKNMEPKDLANFFAQPVYPEKPNSNLFLSCIAAYPGKERAREADKAAFMDLFLRIRSENNPKYVGDECFLSLLLPLTKKETWDARGTVCQNSAVTVSQAWKNLLTDTKVLARISTLAEQKGEVPGNLFSALSEGKAFKSINTPLSPDLVYDGKPTIEFSAWGERQNINWRASRHVLQ
jgi:hypothetical protein